MNERTILYATNRPVRRVRVVVFCMQYANATRSGVQFLFHLGSVKHSSFLLAEDA
jgi:hypothetical protein